MRVHGLIGRCERGGAPHEGKNDVSQGGWGGSTHDGDKNPLLGRRRRDHVDVDATSRIKQLEQQIAAMTLTYNMADRGVEAFISDNPRDVELATMDFMYGVAYVQSVTVLTRIANKIFEPIYAYVGLDSQQDKAIQHTRLS